MRRISLLWCSGSLALGLCDSCETDDESILLQKSRSMRMAPHALHALQDFHSTQQAHAQVFNSDALLEKAKALAKHCTEKRIDDNTAGDVKGAVETARLALNPIIDPTTGGIIVAHNEAVALLATHADAVTSCESAMSVGAAALLELGTVTNAGRTAHSQCRMEAARLAGVQQVSCDDYHTFIHGLPDPACGLDRSNPDAAVAVLQALQTYATDHSGTAAQKKDACDTAQTHATQVDGDCWHAQTVFEADYCASAHACYGYKDCHNRELAIYNDVKVVIESQEQERKDEWRKVSQVVCLLDLVEQVMDTNAMLTENQTAACGQNVSVDHLDITYPDVSPYDGCQHTALDNYPCNAAFIAQEYSGLPNSADLEAACTPCPTIPGGGGGGSGSLIMKTTGDSTFGYSASYWTDDSTLNPDSSPDEEVNAKYPAFNTQAIEKIRVCVDAPTGDDNCFEHALPSSFDSAKDLFNAGYMRDETVPQDEFYRVYAPTVGDYQDCPMQRPGFNIQCHDSNWARFGFCLNCASQGCQNADGNDADASIGIGLRGQSTPHEMGSGWTNYFADGPGQCAARSMRARMTWVYAIGPAPPPSPPPNALNGELVLKSVGDATFGFSSAYWRNTDTLNPSSPVDELVNAKYPSYNDRSFNAIRLCVDSLDNCYTHELATTHSSALALWGNDNFIRDTTIDQPSMLHMFGPSPGSYQDCPMQRPGINIQCNDGNRARFGYCLNCASQGCQNDDSNDADASIGIGLTGQSTPTEMGSGWTNYFASGAGTCSANSMTAKFTWVFVLNSPAPPPPSALHGELVMKSVGDATLGWSSAYWRDSETLNPSSPIDELVNAKYPSYMSRSFNAIRLCVETLTNCYTHSMAETWDSALALWGNDNFIRDTTIDQAEILRIFGPTAGTYQDCGMQRPGFNIQCHDSNRARFGYCVNCASQGCQEADSNDADASIGIGLTGQSTPTEMGSGWTNYFADGPGQCSATSMTAKFTWIFVLTQ